MFDQLALNSVCVRQLPPNFEQTLLIVQRWSLDKEVCSSNFQKENITPEEVIKKHSSFLKSVGISLDRDNEYLPFIYCTPKQHKNPLGFRCITAGHNSSSKQLSVLVGICLKSMLHSAKNFSRYKNSSIFVMTFL